jgi:hypothetical protein
VSQTKAITRMVFGTVPTCTSALLADPAVAVNEQDLWWAAPAGAEAGWGINLVEQSNIFFATWFTYDTDGSPLWLSMTATASGANAYAGTLYRSTGPAFDAAPFDSAQVVLTPVGTGTLTFSNGNAGRFDYTVMACRSPRASRARSSAGRARPAAEVPRPGIFTVPGSASGTRQAA